MLTVATDARREPLDVPLRHLRAQLTAPSATPRALDVDYHAEIGTYELNFVPTTRGDHALQLLYLNQPVTNTRFEVHEGVHVQNTLAKHVHSEVYVGQEGSLVIEAANADGTPNRLGGDAFEISARAPGTHSATLRAYEHATQRGLYCVHYTFHEPGVAELAITINGEHIGNSPVPIVPRHSAFTE